MIALAAAFLWAGAADPAATLTRVLAKVRQELRRMPNYTCVQTITREFYFPKAPVRRACDVMLQMKEHPTLDMQLLHSHTDRLRLEVGISDHGEMHAWPGADGFDERSIDSIVRDGPVGTGPFGALLTAVFQQDVRRFQFVRELTVNGRDRFEFSFDVPAGDSHYKVKVSDSWVITAYRGIVEVDPETDEVTHIRAQTAILPPAAGTCQTTTDVELAMTAIGRGQFPLATVARQRFVGSMGDEAVNTIRFSACREYRGESTVRFFETETAAAKAPAARAARSIPAGLRFAMELTEAIDPAVAAAGDRFEATLRDALRDSRGRTLAPKGARVEGRLLRVQMFYRPAPELIVVLRPEWVESRGGRAALLAARELPKKIKGLILLPFEWETNAALLRFEGKDAIVPKGFAIEWRTLTR